MAKRQQPRQRRDFADLCGRRGVGTGENPAQGTSTPPAATTVAAGTSDRLAVYASRAAAGVSLHHPADRRSDGSGAGGGIKRDLN